MAAPTTRLERALQLYLDATATQQEPAAVLAANPELRDLLEPLFAPDEVPAAGPERLGDFELLREVGRGGMGVVYEARQSSLGRRVALKILAPEFAVDPARVARFRREAATLAQATHPHVVTVLDAGVTEGRPWLAMEFIAGATLAARLQRLAADGGHAGASRRELLAVVLAIAEALQHLHGLGLVHRDVKPANVLLAADGRVLLADFGLARAGDAAPLTRTGMLAGTPHYLAPEYVRLGASGPAVDAWALAVVLYEVATLARPFDGATDDGVLQAVLHGEPADPRRLAPDLPRDLAAILGQALQKEPERRYASLAALAADLRAFLELRPVAARPPTTVQRLRRWVRTEPWRATAALVLVLCAALGGHLLVRWPTLLAGQRSLHEAAYEAAIAEGFLRRGQGQQQLAEAAAERALALRPMAGEAAVVHALVALRFLGPEAAMADLDRLQPTIVDDQPAAQRLRALILGRLGQNEARDSLLAKLGTPQSQIDLLLAAGLHVERRTPADLDAARSLVSLATPSERGECAEALLRLWPHVPFALHSAASHLQWTEPARALALQQEAVEKGLVDSFARFNLAVYADKAGHAAEAAAYAEAAMADPDLPEAQRRGLLQILVDHAPGRIEAAHATWIRLYPGSVVAERELARALALAGAAERGVARVAPFAAAHPDDLELQFVHAWTLQQAGDPAGSFAATERMLALAPADRRAHGLRLLALEARGDAPGRLAELMRYTAAAPDDGDACRELAERLLHEGHPGDRAAALRAAATADRLADGTDAAALEVLIAAHLALGETTAAELVRERLAALRR
jgi:hypothetical protein